MDASWGRTLALVWLPEKVWAQASPPHSVHRLPEMTVTTTREERSPSEVSQAVSIVGQGDIARQTPGTLPDLLRGATGVFVQQTTPGQTAPIIRGLIGSSVLVLVDGMRLNAAFFRPAPNQYFALVDPYNIDRLEIVRGPGSTVYRAECESKYRYARRRGSRRTVAVFGSFTFTMSGERPVPSYGNFATPRGCPTS
jgi:outer membrane cobalamin receptor